MGDKCQNRLFATHSFTNSKGAGKVYGQYGDLNGCPQYGSEEFKNLVLDKLEGLTENYQKLKLENMELKDLILKIFSWKEKSTTTMEETKIRVQRVKSHFYKVPGWALFTKEYMKFGLVWVRQFG